MGNDNLFKVDKNQIVIIIDGEFVLKYDLKDKSLITFGISNILSTSNYSYV